MPSRNALIIVNSQIANSGLPELTSASSIAQSLTQVLSSKEIGDYVVVTLVDQTMRQVREQIARVCQHRMRDDIVLIYYFGYGIVDDTGALILSTSDTNREFADATSVEASFLQSQLGKSYSHNKVVILDCTHSGAFTRGMRQIPNGLVVMTSTDATQYILEANAIVNSEARDSLFTHFLLQGLRSGAADLDHDGQVSADEMYNYVYEQMFTATAKQTPRKWVFNMDAKLIVAHNPAPPDTLFISYAREDADFALQINNALQETAIKTWIDELSVRSGEDWPDRIATAISSARAILFILSPHSLASKWVQRELAFADQKAKPVLPLLYKECDIPAWFELRFGQVQRADFRSGDYATNLTNLLMALKQNFNWRIQQASE